ncbi:hypothetical protein JHS3_31060 [Jeongeupia sp. HS-3]|nr:hypothetical protein JHS3_31060 [Jeongeupia sp. HS-3]
MTRVPVTSQDADNGRSFGLIRRMLIALSISVVLFALAAVSWSIWRSYQETLGNAEQQMLTLARTMDEHVGRTMDASLNTMFAIQQNEIFQLCVETADSACMHAYLQRQLGQTPQMATFAVARADGTLAASTLQYPTPAHNLGSTQYFKVARSQPSSPFYIAEQQLDPTGDRSVIPIVMALNNRRGEFVGVLFAGIDPGYFRQFYRSISSRAGLAIEMFRDDGISLVHYPENAFDVGHDLSHRTFFDNDFGGAQSGTFIERSARDRVTRIYGWRHVGGWPLGVMVGVDRQQVLASWRHDSLVNGGVTASVLALAALLAVYVLRQLRRLESTEDALYLTRVAVERGADMAIWLDPDGIIRYVNATACHRLGYGEHELLGMRLKDVNPTFDPETWGPFWERLREQKHLFEEFVLKTRSGDAFPIESYSNYIVFKGQEYNCAVVRDISERRLAEEAIVKSEQQLRLALDASNTGLFDMPLDIRRDAITSPEYDRLLGFTPGELVETFEKWKEQMYPGDRDVALNAFRDCYAGTAPQFVIEYRRKLKTGEYRWFLSRGKFVEFDGRGKPARLIGTVTDITERKVAQDRIIELANFDTVTGLANRNLLRDELRLAVASAERHSRQLALLFLDLDRFKTINDSLGHTAGDQVLMQVAERLKRIAGKGDILARLGGDEFVIVLTEIDNAIHPGLVAEQILASFADPFVLEAGGFATTTSIGISVYPDDGPDSDTLIRSADVAMYQAKSAGRNNYQYFTADMNARVSERLVLETSMSQALNDNEFELYYQPQVCLRDGRITGAEALIRWRHPEHGLISPAKFIPIAEESRMIVPIGNWVLREACRRAATWTRENGEPMSIAVNLSPLQLHQSNLLEIIADALADAELPPQCLELEVTESVVMQEVEHVMTMLSGIKRLGVKLSVDDFGTGYSSLSYLKRFAFDKLKVDQSFVRDLTTDPNDAAIVLAIIGLGKTLGMSVLAEGVETPEQLDFLRRAGTDAIQGYLFSKPLPAGEFEALLQASPRLMLSRAGGEVVNQA